MFFKFPAEVEGVCSFKRRVRLSLCAGKNTSGEQVVGANRLAGAAHAKLGALNHSVGPNHSNPSRHHSVLDAGTEPVRVAHDSATDAYPR